MSSRRALRLPALLLAGGAVLGGCATGGAGKPDVPELTLDWKALSYGAADCASRAEWVADGLPGQSWDESTVATSRADVTGDGTSEVFVVVACPSGVSEPGESIAVFDVSRGEPAVLGVLGEGIPFQGATVSTKGKAVSVAGLAPEDADPTCCPGHWATVTYDWTGSGFALAEQVTVLTTRPVVAGDLADGEHVGLLRAVTADTAYVDLVEWFEGADAAAACAADGVQDNGWEQCGAYHVRDADDQVINLPVRSGAVASYVDTFSAQDVGVPSAAALVGTSAVSDAAGESAYVRVTVAGGAVTGLAEIYLP
jgi:hypothetical protein